MPLKSFYYNTYISQILFGSQNTHATIGNILYTYKNIKLSTSTLLSATSLLIENVYFLQKKKHRPLIKFMLDLYHSIYMHGASSLHYYTTSAWYKKALCLNLTS